jgi:hypothetical protein
MMDATPKRRCSRWDRDPALDGNGRPRLALITERDVGIFKLLARYRYLTIDDIHAFVGGNRKALSHHLNLLSRRPNLYLNRPGQQRRRADANHRPLIYELDDRAIGILRQEGVSAVPRTHHRNFVHEVMTSRIMASFELGALANPTLRIVSWSEIIASGKTPEAIRNSARPTHIPISFALGGREHQTEIAADGRPFAIEYRLPGQSPAHRFFPGIEADTGTEPIESSDVERSSICRKFAAYLAIEEAHTYRTHFGFPNLFVPFVTTTISRMNSMMNLLKKLTGGRGSMKILFTTFPALNSPEEAALSTHNMLKVSWQRVGCEPLCVGQ